MVYLNAMETQGGIGFKTFSEKAMCVEIILIVNIE